MFGVEPAPLSSGFMCVIGSPPTVFHLENQTDGSQPRRRGDGETLLPSLPHCIKLTGRSALTKSLFMFLGTLALSVRTGRGGGSMHGPHEPPESLIQLNMSSLFGEETC